MVYNLTHQNWNRFLQCSQCTVKQVLQKTFLESTSGIYSIEHIHRDYMVDHTYPGWHSKEVKPVNEENFSHVILDFNCDSQCCIHESRASNTSKLRLTALWLLWNMRGALRRCTIRVTLTIRNTQRCTIRNTQRCTIWNNQRCTIWNTQRCTI